MSVLNITKENFETEVVGSMIPVVIDFWATWCGPCQMQGPIIEEVAEELGDKVKVCKVNVDEEPSIAMNYQIASIPTLVFMKQGMFKNRMIGLQDKETIIEYLNTLID
ncbi:MAG: thioredoxin [Agathobacter sp.]|nr:thioredoxin [Agathobacter sp.]